ncbi:MAG: AAA family ATPase [Magnetococcales bacterium]|nr:AAA family ATPase [Magnetococcales bacterium]
MAFQIKPAQRTQQPILISLWGGSFTGKTYSALRIARGLVEPGKKVGMIDTENRRGLHYAGKVCDFDHLQFDPPFTPERYIEAYRAFEHAGGYGCIIIDSASHVWEGEGGVLDQADSSRYVGIKKWQSPKTSFKRMLNIFLRSPMHIIFLLRSKMGVAQEGRGKEAKIVSTGLEPIFEKNGIFEMTVSVLLGMDHKPMFQPQSERLWCHPSIPPVKAPDEILRSILPGEYLNEEVGAAIRSWGTSVERDIADEARRAASRGADAFRGWWSGLSQDDKAMVKPMVDEMREIAARADEEMARLEADEETSTTLEDQPDPFVGTSGQEPGDRPVTTIAPEKDPFLANAEAHA